MRSISPNQPEEEEEYMQETPETALIAAQAYLLTTQPKPSDPREQMHQAAIRTWVSRKEAKRKYSREKANSSECKGKRRCQAQIFAK
jgi:hypothetical protein